MYSCIRYKCRLLSLVPPHLPVDVPDDSRGVEGSETPVAPPTDGSSATPIDGGGQSRAITGVGVAPAWSSQEQLPSSHGAPQSGDPGEQYHGGPTHTPSATHSYEGQIQRHGTAQRLEHCPHF